jgi:hypothetical protein
MKRLLILLACALLLAAFTSACGDDDDGGRTSDLDVAGVWVGDLTSESNAHGGKLCLELAQLNIAVSGTAYLESDDALALGGGLDRDEITLEWTSRSASSEHSTTPEATTPPEELQFKDGGSFEGEVADATMSGAWTSVDGDSGTWSATRDETLATCSEE